MQKVIHPLSLPIQNKISCDNSLNRMKLAWNNRQERHSQPCGAKGHKGDGFHFIRELHGMEWKPGGLRVFSVAFHFPIEHTASFHFQPDRGMGPKRLGILRHRKFP